jgi:HD-GYP domain-containing protein (c-di-GMP phosphodiesterase class II)
MLVETQPKTEGRRFSLIDQAKALAVVLREEFGIPFTFFDAENGSMAWGFDDEAEQSSAVMLEPSVVLGLAADGRARVTPLSGRRYQLALLLYTARKPALVAVGVVPALTTAAESASGRERAMLLGWLQAVSDRLRLADQLLHRRRHEEAQQTQATTAWEALLAVDQLTRRLRIHKEPARSLEQILEAAFALLPARTLAWVPQQPEEAVLFRGEACLAPADCRQLAAALAQSPDFRAPAPLLCGQVQATRWGSRFPQVTGLMAFLVLDQGPVGWILALNRNDGAGFRRSDAALLTPFVALVELCLRSTQRHQDLKDLLVGLTRSLATTLDAKDSYTYGHSERVARIAVELGRELGLEGDELGDIYLAGLLHDVGKIGIRDTVLRKPGPLTPEEHEHIKQHVTIGYSILADLRQIRNLLPGVLYHHERYDGAGYPDGLAGENIPLMARILAVADAYDAMSNARPYRQALPCRRVEEVLVEGAGTQWDKRVVDAFLRCRQRIHTIRQRGVGDSLRLAIDGALRIDDSGWEEKPGLLPRPEEEQPATGGEPGPPSDEK